MVWWPISSTGKSAKLTSFRVVAPLYEKCTAYLAKKLTFATPGPTREHCLAFRRCASDFGLLPNIHKRECTSGDDDRTFLYYLYDKLQGKKRFVVERTNAWVKSFKRLRFRFDYKASSFEAFLYLAIIVICVRRLLP